MTKVLLDESLPVSLRLLLGGHDIRTVEYMGWKGLKNGKLLAAAEGEGFGLMLTSDGNIPYQQNLRGRKIAVLVLPTNDIGKLREIAQLVEAAIAEMSPGKASRMQVVMRDGQKALKLTPFLAPGLEM